MSKHSPGPWTVSVSADSTSEFDVRESRTVKEQIANARLIAAAPEMLEALVWVRDHCTGLPAVARALAEKAIVRAESERTPEETTPVCSHGVPLTDGQVCNGYVGKPVPPCEHSWQPFPGIPTHRICRKCKKAEDIPQETTCKHGCPSTVHCDVCDPAGRVPQESIPGCLAHPRAPEPYCKNCDKRIDGYRPAEPTLRYQVTVVGEPMQDFTSIDSAIDYAARHVYLPPDGGADAKSSLRTGEPFSYAYGFKQVEIVPVKTTRQESK